MEFKKQKRDTKLFRSDELRYWRLASVDEVRNNLVTIKEKQILESWDICRLLDGFVDGPGYRYTIKNEYHLYMGEMLLVKTTEPRSPDGEYNGEMYDGVKLNSEGREAALLLSCEDKIIEVMCFVLQSIIDISQEASKRQAELDSLTETLKKTFSQGRTILHYAADQPFNENHAVLITQLILWNFDYGNELIKAADKYGRTALQFAALHGHIELCTFLIRQCGLKADVKDRNGENLLHFAVNSSKVEIVKRLMEIEEVKSLIDSKDRKYKTPLHKAAANANIEIIDVLLESMNQENMLKYIGQHDSLGQTALHEATRGGHCEAVRYLLEKGSMPLLERNSEGKTALHYSAQLADQNAATEIAQRLLNHCKSEEEKLLLLWASAKGMGTAEQSAESSLKVQVFLKLQREHAMGSSSDLLLSAIRKGYEALAWELINRGADTSQLENSSNGDLSEDDRKRVKKFHERMEKMPEGGRDQPTIYDSLGRRAFAEGLAALFLNPYVKSPVTVGISGDWGMGKSSLMLQTEMILLQAAAQLAFPHILPLEDFPGSKQYELTPKGQEKYRKIKNGVKKLFKPSEIANIKDPLVHFLDSYQDKYYQVYKSLALMDRREMFRLKGKPVGSSSDLGMIPSILTVRYNAWHYQNESEAWAGLAFTITEAMEGTMTRSQRIRSRCMYSWKEQGRKICFELLLPCLLAFFISCWATWLVWILLNRTKNREVQDLKYGSIPVTLVVLFWTIMRQMNSVFQPVSAQIMGYVRSPDYAKVMGYQHQVISDINFLIKQISEKPNWFWKFLACNWFWIMCGLYPDTVKGTSIPKSSSHSKADIRIIVFVDDLDRCDEAVILQVLSAVNLVLSVCKINVILGMDTKMIAKAIANKYKDDNNSNGVDLAEKYLSKIVQLPLALPDSSNDERIVFLNEQLGEEFNTSGDDVQGSSQGARPSVEESYPPSCPEINPTTPAGAQIFDIENPKQKPLESGLESWPLISKFRNCFVALSRWLCGRCSGPADIGSLKLKSTPINSHLILPSYTEEERAAISFLSTQATQDPQIPRDWKRFLTYHRLAWNILFRLKQVKNIAGWQVQLIVWVFCCWQWKQNINDIIKNWKEFTESIKRGTVKLEDSSLKIIAEYYREKSHEDDMQKDKWRLLIETLETYDVPIESILCFQKFRVHCEIGYLRPLPTNATSTSVSTNSGAGEAD